MIEALFFNHQIFDHSIFSATKVLRSTFFFLQLIMSSVLFFSQLNCCILTITDHLIIFLQFLQPYSVRVSFSTDQNQRKAFGLRRY